MKELLTPEVQAFISDNQHISLPKFLLGKSPFPQLTVQQLAQQIQGKQIARKKFPLFYHNSSILYPPKINLEQTSSQITAEFKANMVKGKIGADITGGLGVDTYFLSQNFKEFYHIEQNTDLQALAQNNFQTLKASHIKSFCANGLEFLDTLPHLDLLYIDPSRRDDNKKKVFLLEDLSPNIVKYLNHWLGKSSTVMVKLSPLIDLNVLHKLSRHLVHIYNIAHKNELKEVLCIFDAQQTTDEPVIHAVNLASHQTDFQFTHSQEQNATPIFHPPLTYIYEPNVAVAKSGAFNYLTQKFQLYKLHPNTHLYTSNDLIKDFPGRIFANLVPVTQPKKQLKNQSIQLIRRNFPMSVHQIQSKFKCISDGNSPYIFTQSIEGVHIFKAHLY